MVGTARWQDWTSFALGLWLAVSPWIVGYDSDHAATCNAAFVGVALAIGAHFEIGLDELWTEWLNFAVGLWLLAAPFALEFKTTAATSTASPWPASSARWPRRHSSSTRRWEGSGSA
jgi:hypothetical protein